MTAPRILIVTYNWPPRNTIATHRSYAWAKYWSEAGAHVTVLTAKKIATDAPLDLDFPTLEKVRVIEVPFGGAGKAFLTRLVHFPVVRKCLSRLRVFMRNNINPATDPRSAWRTAVRPYLRDIATENDFVVSTFGPDTAHFIANDIKSINPDIFWVADYRDLWSQNPMIPWSDNIRSKVQIYEERSVGRNANLVTAVSMDMIRKLSLLFDREFFLSMNGFDFCKEDVRSLFQNSVRKRRDGPFRIVYTGSIYRGHSDPTPLLEALANLIDRQELQINDIRVEFYGVNIESLDDLVSNSRYKDFLYFCGYVPREKALDIQREADLLLLLISSNPNSKGIITGKLFEYISSGSPILGVCPSEFEVCEVLQQTGTGITSDGKDIARIEDIIKDVLNMGGTPCWFQPRLDEIFKYTRKEQAITLLNKMVESRFQYEVTGPLDSRLIER